MPQKGKNAYLLSVIDVHTRRIVKDYFSFNIKQKQVIELLSELFDELDYPKNAVIRSDNGSQFIAKNVREYLSLIGVLQEFTHIATPEENADIEAYHGTLSQRSRSHSRNRNGSGGDCLRQTDRHGSAYIYTSQYYQYRNCKILRHVCRYDDVE
ncbi:DDE-type integrase/transposase/recombinase [Sphingobacterium thermophilum]|uniref:DDE-type integrase/transposase/recombinase n=1 Tax=Sphingobacterium thermophilum TaxID=768534 RepID=UPI003CD0AEBB